MGLGTTALLTGDVGAALGVEQRHLAADPVAARELPGPGAATVHEAAPTLCLQGSQPVPASPPTSSFTALQHP